MKFTTYRLYFQGSLHLGDVRLDYGNSEDQIHSDTLQAAVIAALAAVGDAPNSGDLPFAVSSMFPFYTDQETETPCYFFPRPMLRFNTTIDTSGFAKKLKRSQWLDQQYFEQVIHGECIADFGGSDQSHFQDGFVHRKRINSPFIFRQTLPRVKVPRSYDSKEKADNEPQIFYMQVVRFTKGAGMYFLANGDDASLAMLERALTILQDQGFGTDRNVGNGHFEWEKGTLTLRTPEEGSYMTNLSLFCPESPEQLSQMLQGDGHYELKKRGGWITTDGDLSIRKRSAYMMREGSVFSHNITKSPTGHFIVGAPAIDFKPDLAQTPNIWRSGKAIFLPVKL